MKSRQMGKTMRKRYNALKRKDRAAARKMQTTQQDDAIKGVGGSRK